MSLFVSSWTRLLLAQVIQSINPPPALFFLASSSFSLLSASIFWSPDFLAFFFRPAAVDGSAGVGDDGPGSVWTVGCESGTCLSAGELRAETGWEGGPEERAGEVSEGGSTSMGVGVTLADDGAEIDPGRLGGGATTAAAWVCASSLACFLVRLVVGNAAIAFLSDPGRQSTSPQTRQVVLTLLNVFFLALARGATPPVRVVGGLGCRPRLTSTEDVHPGTLRAPHFEQHTRWVVSDGRAASRRRRARWRADRFGESGRSSGGRASRWASVCDELRNGTAADVGAGAGAVDI